MPVLAGLLIAAAIAAILIVPLAVKGKVIWHDLVLKCQIRLYLGPAPVVNLQAIAGLEPLTLKASLNGASLHRRRKAKPSSSRVFYLRTLSNAVRCRQLIVQFDLGVAQDAAATAIGYGTLSALTNMTLAWAKSRGAEKCSGSVEAHFDEPRYEGTIEGIFQTNLAHIMFGAVKAWRDR